MCFCFVIPPCKQSVTLSPRLTLMSSDRASGSDGQRTASAILQDTSQFCLSCSQLHACAVLAHRSMFREHLLWWHTYSTQISLLPANTFTRLLAATFTRSRAGDSLKFMDSNTILVCKGNVQVAKKWIC
jgi:hypothetical protein